MKNRAKRSWLMKSEPNVYSIDDLQRDGKTLWEGVRNYQARNFMWKEMAPGDHVLFYHSNAEPPGIVGLAKVSRSAAADPTQFNERSPYYDAKATKGEPRWYCVEIEFLKKFKRPVTLAQLKADRKLKDMLVIQKGQRLSVQPVTDDEYSHVLQLADKYRS